MSNKKVSVRRKKKEDKRRKSDIDNIRKVNSAIRFTIFLAIVFVAAYLFFSNYWFS